MKFSFLKSLFLGKEPSSEFEKTFPKYPFWSTAEKELYQMLKELDESSNSEFAEQLVEKVNSLHYASNIEGYYQHFFPIVSHILYYNPEFEDKLLHHLIGPIFAGGTTNESEIMEMIIISKDFRLKENPHFLSKEGIAWIENTLPTMNAAIKREVKKCWKALE
jgi:hypothetical protein